MDDRVALSAAQKLSVDVANLGYRLAVLEAHCELLAELASRLRPAEWKRMEHHPIVQDPDEVELPMPAPAVIIEGEQVLVLDEVLRCIQSLR
jgi:hypothetical protein